MRFPQKYGGRETFFNEVLPLAWSIVSNGGVKIVFVYVPLYSH